MNERMTPQQMILPLIERLESGELTPDRVTADPTAAADAVAEVLKAAHTANADAARPRTGSLSDYCGASEGDLLLHPEALGAFGRLAYERGKHDERELAATWREYVAGENLLRMKEAHDELQQHRTSLNAILSAYSEATGGTPASLTDLIRAVQHGAILALEEAQRDELEEGLQ